VSFLKYSYLQVSFGWEVFVLTISPGVSRAANLHALIEVSHVHTRSGDFLTKDLFFGPGKVNCLDPSRLLLYGACE
jgi:hypothetical protein